MPTPKDRTINRLKKILVVFLGLLFGCLIAEVALRIAGYSYPIFYQTDIDRGYAPIPGLAGWSWPENKVYIRYNSDGFRDVEHTKEKPPGTIRIAVLGDSYAEGRQVPLEKTFWSVLQDELRHSPALVGKNVEVLNFGVDGYGTVHELQTLRQRVWQYSPDVVLLTVTVYNDITDNYRLFKGADDTPYFKLDGGRLVLDDSFRESRKFKYHSSALFGAWVALHNHSRLIQLFHHAQFALKTALRSWKENTTPPAPVPTEQGGGQTHEPSVAELTATVGIQNMVFREPADNDWNEAWRLTEALISQIRDETVEHQATFMMVTIPSDIQVYPAPASRDSMGRKLGAADLFYPDRRLQALAEREEMSFLDIPIPMQEAADRDKIFFHGFGKEMGNGHWNEAGHEFAGKLLAEKLTDIIFK